MNKYEFLLGGYVELAPVKQQNIDGTSISETSYTVTWKDADGDRERYEVDCQCVNSVTCHSHINNSVPLNGNTSNKYYTYKCDSLTPGVRYNTTIKTIKTNWDTVSVKAPQAKTGKGYAPNYIISTRRSVHKD